MADSDVGKKVTYHSEHGPIKTAWVADYVAGKESGDHLVVGFWNQAGKKAGQGITFALWSTPGDKQGEFSA